MYLKFHKKIVEAALKNGTHVISPNKALISKHGNTLSQLAEKNNVNLEFEAAVCGGVPIIRSLKEGLIANKINRVYGIFNGTSNYILSAMEKVNKVEEYYESYKHVLSEDTAQKAIEIINDLKKRMLKKG